MTAQSASSATVVSPRATFGLILIGAIAFLVVIYFAIFGLEPNANGTADANSFSNSAIGHKAFVETMRRLDIRVRIGRYDTFARAAPDDLILILEPRSTDFLPALESLRKGQKILIALPKRSGERDPKKPDWLARSELIDRQLLELGLDLAESDLEIRRVDRVASWSRNDFGFQPSLSPVQLVADAKGKLKPLIAAKDGILLGTMTLRGVDIWLLSDPDLIANHGLGDGDNADLSIAIIRRLLPEGGAVTIDETIHGFAQEPNLLPRLLAPPFLGVTIAAAFALLVLAWMGAIRFGRPRLSPQGLAAGKTSLIDNAADLLRYGARPENVIRRFAQVLMTETARRLHAPKGLNEKSLIAWLDQTARLGRRQGRLSLDRLMAEAEALAESGSGSSVAGRDRLLADLADWKEEMLDGSGQTPRDRR